MGKGRTTTGMIVACLVRDVVHGQVRSEHDFHSYSKKALSTDSTK